VSGISHIVTIVTMCDMPDTMCDMLVTR
jgi:hypothetical protein